MSKTQQKLVVQKLTTNFRAAVCIKEAPICKPAEGEICVKNKFVGINADDINVTRGRNYFADENIPFSCGLEGIGNVVSLGKDVTNIQVGDLVAYLSYGHSAFAEYTCVPVKDAFSVPNTQPEYLALLISGLTASIGIETLAKVKSKETVLITAAAGGLGHLTVQIAKSYGCHVIATCSTEEKEGFLKGLGCDRVINYKKEDLHEVLSKEYPTGIDVIWETVGHPVFDICLKNVATRGRLLIMGGTSDYKTDGKEAFPLENASSLRETIFYRGATVIGGNADLYSDSFASCYKTLKDKYEKGQIEVVCDTGNDKEFVGMDGIIRGMEHLMHGKNTGKVIAKIY